MVRRLWVMIWMVGLVLPFVGRPVHLDDTNFLALAQGAAADWWRPHAVEINWQGKTELAFDVLSNPPGIGWWLAPVVHGPLWLMHLWMLPWVLLAAWGTWHLGDRFAGGRAAPTVILTCASPIGLLAAHSLMPDLPLFALGVAGMAGIVHAPDGKRALPWALLLGAGALFRYSGAALIPVAASWFLVERKDWRSAAWVAVGASVPLLLLGIHDLLAYGDVHLLAMMAFQGVANTPEDFTRKFVAAVAMFGAAGLLPLLGWRRGWTMAIGWSIGLGLGFAACEISGFALQSEPAAFWSTLLASGAGGASLVVVLGSIWRENAGGVGSANGVFHSQRETWWLAGWLVLGLLFLLQLRFTAARYWLPFLVPAVLLGLRLAGSFSVRLSMLITPSLAVLLAVDDAALARSQAQLAERVVAMVSLDETLPSGRWFAGHWGWQFHMEKAGWNAIDDDGELPTDSVFASSMVSWPQGIRSDCKKLIGRFVGAHYGWGPRVHTTEGGANFHSFLISGDPPLQTYAPWSFGRDPDDVVTLWKSCSPSERLRLRAR